MLIDATQHYVKIGEFVNVHITEAADFDLYGGRQYVGIKNILNRKGCKLQPFLISLKNRNYFTSFNALSIRVTKCVLCALVAVSPAPLAAILRMLFKFCKAIDLAK